MSDDPITREQAIETGVLLDVSHAASNAGINCHVALTRSALKAIEASGKTIQEAMAALRQVQETSLALSPTFDVGKTRLVASFGPGDSGEAVITVMTEKE